MIGRIVGFIIGVAIALTGYGVWRPAALAKYVDFSHVALGDFAQYRSLVAWQIMAVGVVVALASLQRASERRRPRPAAAMFGAAEAASAHEPPPPPADAHDHAPHAEEAHDAHGGQGAHDSHAHHDTHGHHDAHDAHANHEPAHAH